MSTYPSVIATLTNPNPTDKLNSPSHSTIETNQNNEVVALETFIGTLSSAVGTLVYDVRATASNGGGHVQSANKGGTGQISFNKGDILVASSNSVLSKLAVGGDGQAIVADSTQSSGLNYVAITVSPGFIQMYGGVSSVSGWLLCDGTSYPQSSYTSLYNVIGSIYGSADGTHFNVPDLRGRVPIGVGTGIGGGGTGTGLPSGSSTLSAISRGTWKGEEVHTQTLAELATHTHGISGTQQTNTGGSGAFFTGTGASTTSASTGSSTPFNVVQPVMGVNFIIKT